MNDAPGPTELEHVGSTPVPQLRAKPIIDVALVVADPTDEAAYVPALEHAGFLLHLREPGWHQHRLLRGVDPAGNLHVFGPACAEVERMLLFRDRRPGARRTCNPPGPAAVCAVRGRGCLSEWSLARAR